MREHKADVVRQAMNAVAMDRAFREVSEKCGAPCSDLSPLLQRFCSSEFAGGLCML